MGTGSLALALLLGGIGAPADGLVVMKDRAISIPYNLTVAPSEVNEVLLFVSIDQGKVWSRAGVIKPTEKFFQYHAPTDGLYWFNVAVVYRNGTQVPADVSQVKTQQKVLFDSQNPVVRLISAERVGDEVAVTWDIQEPNADLASLKLEYRSTESATAAWSAAPASPGLAGQAKFRVNSPGPIALRLGMQDMAGNFGSSEKAVSAGAISAPGISSVTQPTAVNGPATGVAPMPDPQAFAAPAPAAPPVVPAQAPVVEPAPTQVPLATSNRTEAVRTPVAPATHTTLRAEPPEIHCTNEPQVTVDYEIENQGPSGVAKVEVYMSPDDGRTWVKWQELTRNDFNRSEPAQATKLPVTVRLPEREGVFGYRIVPISGSQLSVGSPQSGAEPEFRLQADRTAPYVELYKPEAGANKASTLVLQWKATDANLGPNPIRIFWSEQVNGPWQAVSADPQGLPNTGRHEWVLPANPPLKVFLKIIAEDRAGNAGEAVTPQPVVVDLLKPVGRFMGIADGKRRN